MGFNNYVWLKRFAQDKIGGGWFDFGDCTPESYLMQAYQTVLAGADEMVLFQAGSILTPDPCLEPLQNRQGAVAQLSSILNSQQLLGSMAYKPPHSEGSDANGAANLYVFDYFATLGLSPVMSNSPATKSSTVLLARQAADDPKIMDHVNQWLRDKKTLIMTPDFLMAVNNKQLFKLAGFSKPFTLQSGSQRIDHFQIDQTNSHQLDSEINLRLIPLPDQAITIISGINGDTVFPFLTQQKHEHGQVLVLNIDTFTHEEFAPDKEQFLPPRSLTVKDIPAPVIQRLQKEVIYPYGIAVIGDNNLGVYFYDQNTLVLTNFTSNTKQATLQYAGDKQVKLDERFNHLPESTCTIITKNNNASQVEVTIPSWEITVVTWD
jgi:hypothetical protein